ncbi:MAG: substrate-binding domain-containing protein, partial [SAR324 cluster bacterium]|nr:substrate-binding domain-containing protein [SAR324 cluster bacterium]
IGYDDLEIAKTNNPQLTVMRPPGKNAGEQLVEMLMEVIDGHSPELLHQIWQAEIVLRQSTCQI